MTLVLRIPKGDKLTKAEMDNNLTYLEGLSQSKLGTGSFTAFTSSYTTGSFTGSFKGDGSGLTGIPSGTSISTGSFATTGSNQFKASQTISGSLTVSGSIGQRGIGEANTFIGDGAGFSNIPGGGSGDYNTFIGVTAGGANVYGRGNTAIGPYALDNNLNGINNIAIGTEAGRYATNFDGNFISNESIYIGNGAQAKSNNQINQIVIGNFVTGNGNNTVTIGDSNITATYLRGNIVATGSLLVSGSARLTGGVTGSSFTGSFVGDGSGLTGISGVTPIATGSFATTGSNSFMGTETITGALRITGSLNLRSPSYPTSGSLVRIDDTRTHIFVRPSGSNTSGNIQLYDSGDSRSILIINASQTSIGSEATSNAYGNNSAQNYIRGNTQFFQNITSSANIQAVSFIGDGSGLTGIPVIGTGSFATTGSNTFVGNKVTPPKYLSNTGSAKCNGLSEYE